MARIDKSLGSSHDDCAGLVDTDEELRVLTALIGCILVAEDAGARPERRSALPHLLPAFAVTGLAKAS